MNHDAGVMLAEPLPKGADPADHLARLDESGDWLFDLKWDGVRCLANVDHGSVALTNRNDVDITYRYPDVVETLSGLDDVLLDGEIVAFDKDGRPDFNQVARRDRQGSVDGAKRMAKQVPVTYMAFDCLQWDEWVNALSPTPLTGRLAMLDALLPPSNVVRPSVWSYSGEAMWALVDEHDLEGLVAKRAMSDYRIGRHPDWVKLKKVNSVSAVVVGSEPGKGRRDGTVGALLLAVINDGEIMEVGKVGTGLTDADLAHAGRLIAAGQPFVVEVAYSNFTTDGRLRFPSFRGFRSDVDPMSCTADQLETR